MKKKVDHREICWSCGSNLMVSMGDYYKCRSCGVTYTEVTRIGPSPVVIEEEIIHDKKGNRIRTTRYRPDLINKSKPPETTSW